MKNSYECVRFLIDETNIDATDLSNNNESSVLLACKNGVSIEILETLLVNLRSIWDIEKIKDFLEVKDHNGLKAYDYCKIKKRSDLAILLEGFVDTDKSIIDISYEYLKVDFKA